MRFITSENGTWHLQKYLAYVAESLETFPPGAREFATAEWHYDIADHRCPHDSWVESVSLKEVGVGLRQEDRSTTIVALLKGAFHDGWLRLTYEGVRNYALTLRGNEDSHGDWLIDELIVDSGDIIHEIEFENARWTIRCKDVTAAWSADAPTDT